MDNNSRKRQKIVCNKCLAEVCYLDRHQQSNSCVQLKCSIKSCELMVPALKFNEHVLAHSNQVSNLVRGEANLVSFPNFVEDTDYNV